MTRIATVTAEFELRLVVQGGPSLPVTAALRYSAADPWAVQVAFRTGGADDLVVEWLFGRQLLTDGLGSPVGEGDVRVWPALHDGERVVNLAMTSPSGSALFEIDRDGLTEFLQQTYLAVPTGTESEGIDFDAEVALLFAF